MHLQLDMRCYGLQATPFQIAASRIELLPRDPFETPLLLPMTAAPMNGQPVASTSQQAPLFTPLAFKYQEVSPIELYNFGR